MGMYDSVYLPFKCPKCGFSQNHHDWQTKSFACILENYKPMDIPKLDNFEVKDGKFEIHTICPKCKAFVGSYGYIKDSKIMNKLDAERVQ